MKHLLQTTAMIAAVGASVGMAHAAVDKPDFGACNTDYKAVDADGNGTVSQSEATQAAEYEFERLDSDGDGTISKAEWRNCAGVAYLEQVNEPKTAGADQQSETQGASGSGMTQDQSTGQTSQQSATSGTAESQDQMATGSIRQPSSQAGTLPTIGEYTDENFAAADTDKSGDVDAGEAATFSTNSFHDREARGDEGGQPAATPGDGGISGEEQAARTGAASFAQRDADGNGRLTREEWVEQPGEQSYNDFSVLDTNNNGIISQDEWQKALMAAHQRAVQAAQAAEPNVWVFWYAL